MNAQKIRLVLGAVVLFLLTAGSAFAAPSSQQSEFKEISGAPLRIQVGSNGSVQVYHEAHPDTGAAYGTADSGFFLAIGDDIYGPDLTNTNPHSAYPDSTNTFGLTSHEGPTGSGSANDPFRIVTSQTLDGSGANLSVVQTVSYVDGNDYFRQDWDITNTGSDEVCFNAYHAADIFFAGSDRGQGYYNEETGAVGGKATDSDGDDWFMVFSPVTPATHYQEGDFATIWNTVNAGSDLDDSIVTESVDNGIALQWNRCLQPGETVTISDLWSFGDTEETVIPPTPEPTPITIPNNASGDVHLFTPDGLIYDFQEVGEFTALQSSDGSVIVQARQENPENNPRVSINTAVAMMVGDDKLEFYVKPDRLFEVNDVETDLPTSDFDLPGGGRITFTWGANSPDREDFTIYWPDGNTGGRVILFSNNHIDYGVARLGGSLTYAGILGNLDGNAQNDITLQGGDLIKPPATVEQLKTFGASWLVGDESLFNNRIQDTPVDWIATEELDEEDRERAEATCREAGISDPIALRNCIYDVAATGDEIFVESAQVLEEATKDLPPSAKVPAQPGETLGGVIFDADQDGEETITILDDDDLILTIGTSEDGTGYLRFHIYRDGEYVVSYSVGTDADVADAVAGAMVATAAAPEEAAPEEAAPEEMDAEASPNDPESTVCFDAVQGNIAWNYEGTTTWDPVNVNNLCSGAESSVEPALCFEQVMHDGIDYGGGTEWRWEDAVNLCQSTQDAESTVQCFRSAIDNGESQEEAIASCNG